jgi:signal transduction histidine kinase
LSLGFGVLLFVIGLSAAALERSMAKVYSEVASIQERFRTDRNVVDRVRSEIFLAAILVRDYLLEPSPEAAANEREALEELRASTQRHLEALEQVESAERQVRSAALREAVTEYWKSLDPVFSWTPEEKLLLARSFLRRSVVPHREAPLAAAESLAELSRQQAVHRQEEVLQTQQELKSDLRRILAFAMLLGTMVAVASVTRTRSLEATNGAYVVEIERSARELRKLSQKLAKAQEDERRNISRELHDQVGQMLTALRMELANVESFRGTAGRDFTEHMAQAKKLAEETLGMVRHISAGLRPSMLDELGLAPALQWQAREFGKHCGIVPDMAIKGNFDHLSEAHRTCIYRVVQEALTNCAKHACAGMVRVSLESGSGVLVVTVEDDGVGFETRSVRDRGIGLLGIEERVRELGGRVELQSQPSRGTILRCEIPMAGR